MDQIKKNKTPVGKNWNLHTHKLSVDNKFAKLTHVCSEKGITIVSLIITIVVLGILAGISIAVMFNKGLIGSAKEAKEVYENASQNELDRENELKNYKHGKYAYAENSGELSLQDTDSLLLKNYRIYGESVQDESKGTPSPTNPVEVESVGELVTEGEHAGEYKIPVTVTGRNLFDVSKSPGFTSQYGGITSTIDGNVIRVTSSSANPRGTYLNLGTFNPGSYYISANFISGITYCRITLNSKVIANESYTIRNEQGKVITISETTAIGLYQGLSKDEVFEISDIQITKSNVPTEYEPFVGNITTNIYLKEPLRKVENYADYIDFKNGKVYRYVGKVSLNSGMAYNYTGYVEKVSMYRAYFSFYKNGQILSDIMMKSGWNLPGKCNVLPCNKQTWNNWSEEQIHLGQNNNAIYVVTNSELSTQEDLYEYLSNSGSVEPYVIYPLATPKEESIDLPEIPIYDEGITNISVDTSVSPSKIEINY